MDYPLRADLEALLLKYNVDLVVTGHAHCYERTYPVANGISQGIFVTLRLLDSSLHSLTHLLVICTHRQARSKCIRQTKSTNLYGTRHSGCINL
jgi:hypothetical protein